MKCPQCQTENIDDAAYCVHCGYQFKSQPVPILWTGVRKKICTNCFFPSYRTNNYCTRCGHKLPDKDNIHQSYLSQENIFAKLLIQEGIITENNRLEIETINKGKQGYNFMDTLIESQFAREEDILQFLSKKLDIPFLPISHFSKPDKSLSQLIPEGVARRRKVLVVDTEHDFPLIAMSNPLSVMALSELRSILPSEAHTVICTANDIKKTFDSYYPKKVTPIKVSSAAQVDAYDLDIIDSKPDTKSMDITSPAVKIREKKKSSFGKFVKLLILLIIVGGIGFGVFYHFKDALMLPKHLKSGNDNFAAKNYSTAIKEFSFYLKYKPDDIDVHFKLARALHAVEDYGKALDHFYIVLNKRPDSVEAHYLAGLSSFNYKVYGQAIDEFKKVLRLDPKRIDANKYIGIANIQLGDSDSAIPYLERTVKHNPKNHALSKWLVQAYLTSKQYKKVITLTRKIIQKQGGTPKVLYYIGYAKAATGNFKHGIMHYKESGLFDSDSAEKHLKKAFTLLDGKNYDEAISEYIKVLTIKENNAEAYNNLGIIYRKKRYKKSSQDCFKKAKRILKIH